MVIWGEELTWTVARKKKKKPFLLYSYWASSHIRLPPNKIHHLPFLDDTAFISKSSVSQLRPKRCWNNKDNYAAHLHKTAALCADLILPFFGEEGEQTTQATDGVEEKKARGEESIVSVEYLRRPELRSTTRRLINEPKVRRIRSEIASILLPQRKVRRGGGGGGGGERRERRKRCQLFHPLTDSDCHGRKTDECLSDLWCFAVHIKCRLCSSRDTLKS